MNPSLYLLFCPSIATNDNFSLKICCEHSISLFLKVNIVKLVTKRERERERERRVNKRKRERRLEDYIIRVSNVTNNIITNKKIKYLSQ